jgi:hypothetical protein
MYSFHCNYKKFPVNIFPNANVSCNMGDDCAICTADALFGSHSAQHNFQLFVVTVKSHPSVLNTRKSISAPKPKLHRIKDRGYYRPVEWASMSYILSTESQVQVLSDSMEQVRRRTLASGTHVRGFELGRSRRIFHGEKILSMPSFGGEVNSSVPCRRFAACKRSLQIAWNSVFDGKINRTFIAHSSPFPC